MEETKTIQAEIARAGALQLLGGAVQKPPIGEAEVRRAAEILQAYKHGKSSLESRVVEDELWYKLRHWEVFRKKRDPAHPAPEPTSAWLFNAILNKHADAMDNLPEPLALPRERSDEESARALSSILPVIFEQNDFEKVYSDAWWEKLKHGCPCYGVFWNSRKENGLGDIDIKNIDLLNLFWEPGITDIQSSRNLFIVALEEDDLLEQEYPQLHGKLGGKVIDVKEYLYDDTVDNSGKSVVVDWYYKKRAPGGRTILHYVKFVGNTVLFASENDPLFRDRGWYDHGKYPVVLDPLFPEKGTPVGFGYVAICKDPQMYIDKLFGNILEHSMMATKPRSFLSSAAAINEEEYLDWNRPFVHVEGELDERRIREIRLSPLSGIYVTVAQMKIEEMKETAANRDVNAGSATRGVTAASAIAALQEAGSKVSRDMLAAGERAYREIASICVELIRQFYDEARSFRITGDVPGTYRFERISNRSLRDQLLPPAYPGQENEPDYSPMYRRPVFDIKIVAQKKNPFSLMEQNERAKELYAAGFFDPARAREALGALEMMRFEGIEKVRQQVRQGMTDALPEQTQAEAAQTGIAADVAAALTPQPSYAQRLARRTK